MRIRSVRGSHHNRSPGHQPTEIQTPGQMRLALEWRDCWRYEKLKNQNVTVDPVWKDKDKDKKEKEKRKRFAEGIARAEFGRAYWDERRPARCPTAARAEGKNQRLAIGQVKRLTSLDRVAKGSPGGDRSSTSF